MLPSSFCRKPSGRRNYYNFLFSQSKFRFMFKNFLFFAFSFFFFFFCGGDIKRSVATLMVTPIDYSKWDRIEFEESDEERFHPLVTRLKSGSSVSIDSSGLTLGQKTEAKDQGMSAHTEEGREKNSSIEESTNLAKLFRNGAKEEGSHWWCQSEDRVTISFLVDPRVRAKDVSEVSLEEVKVNHSGNDIIRPCLTFAIKSTTNEVTRVTKIFAFLLDLGAGDIESCWELQTIAGKRFLLFSLQKKNVPNGVVVWWNRCFLDDVSEVDTTTIADRKITSDTIKFKQMWEQAHESFKRARKQGDVPSK